MKDTFKELGLDNAKSVVAPGVVTMQAPDGVSSLDDKTMSLYRRGVGKCTWLVPLRYDIYYATKELARHLQSPTMEQMMGLERNLTLCTDGCANGSTRQARASRTKGPS